MTVFESQAHKVVVISPSKPSSFEKPAQKKVLQHHGSSHKNTLIAEFLKNYSCPLAPIQISIHLRRYKLKQALVYMQFRVIGI